MKILFVCRGNVGRSQMAEAYFNMRGFPNHHSVSAGTKVMDKDGNGMDGQEIGELESAQNTIASMLDKGIDIKQNLRSQITNEMILDTDRVIVMAEEYSLPDFLKESVKVEYWEVEDPKGKSKEVTDTIRDEVFRRVEGLLSKI